jgi:hypothetical protein
MVIEEDSVKKEKEARSIGAVDGFDVDMVLITRSSERQRGRERGRRRVSALTPS